MPHHWPSAARPRDFLVKDRVSAEPSSTLATMSPIGIRWVYKLYKKNLKRNARPEGKHYSKLVIKLQRNNHADDASTSRAS
jgi:hypothetical protein